MKKHEIVSVILPCLNEEKGIVTSINWAKEGLSITAKRYRIYGRIIVVDNGSSDSSVSLAKKSNVTVIQEPKRGYGRAYLTGLSKIKSDTYIIADSDASYDLREIPKLYGKIVSGSKMVIGSRFLTDAISPKAMPFFNRYVGNPFLTLLINIFYGCRITDTQSGFRAFTRDAVRKMNLKSTGMEFASEMIIKALTNGIPVTEVGVSYFPRKGISKLSPVSDAWRHIKAILMYSPTYAIILPGMVLCVVGIGMTLTLIPGPLIVGKYFFDIHTMIGSVFLSTLGMHIVIIGIVARLYTAKELHISGGLLTQIIAKHVSVNTLLLWGALLLLVGLGIITSVIIEWTNQNFGNLNRQRELIAAMGLSSIGTQLIFSSLLMGLVNKEEQL